MGMVLAVYLVCIDVWFIVCVLDDIHGPVVLSIFMARIGVQIK